MKSGILNIDSSINPQQITDKYILIVEDIIDSGLYERTEKILFEDHCRKIRGLSKKRDYFLKRIDDLGILKKFYLQDVDSNQNKYIPLIDGKRLLGNL